MNGKCMICGKETHCINERKQISLIYCTSCANDKAKDYSACVTNKKQPNRFYNSPSSCAKYIDFTREQRKIYNAYKAEAKPIPSLYLYGVNGCGKTELALRIVYSVMDQYPVGVQATFVDLTRLSGKMSILAQRHYFLATILSCNIIVIDDLWNHSCNVLVTEALLRIINTALSENKTIIITSNFKPTTELLDDRMFKARKGIDIGMYKAINDRILSKCNVVHLTSSSFRKSTYEKQLSRN